MNQVSEITSAKNRPAYPNCPKPVIFLAFIEHNLKTSRPYREQPKPKIVKGMHLRILDIRRIDNESIDHEHGKRAHGNVDIKGITPAICVS